MDLSNEPSPVAVLALLSSKCEEVEDAILSRILSKAAHGGCCEGSSRSGLSPGTPPALSGMLLGLLLEEEVGAPLGGGGGIGCNELLDACVSP